MSKVTFGTRRGKGVEWIILETISLFQVMPKKDRIVGKELKTTRVLCLKLLNHRPSHSHPTAFSDYMGRKGQFPTGGEADFNCMAVTFLSSSPQAGTVPFWLALDPLTATSCSSFGFGAASTQAAEETDRSGPQTVLPAPHSARSPLGLQTAGKPGNALPCN